jgi:predicted RNA binding protein YcfA (HicA-like mRNA interferase family)
MSVQRRELVDYLEANGFSLLRQGKKHAIYTDGVRTIPVKRHRRFDRITANQICKQAGLAPRF